MRPKVFAVSGLRPSRMAASIAPRSTSCSCVCWPSHPRAPVSRSLVRCTSPGRSFSHSSISRTALELAYDVYEPPSGPPLVSSSPDEKSADGSLSSALAAHDDEGSTARWQEKPPVVFLHGLFGSKKNHMSISKILAGDLNRRIYALDLRNHGDSPHSPQHDYSSMADDVERFISQHATQGSARRAVLIGHSMGAKAAMTVALRSPDLVESLIAVDNAPVDAALSNDFAKYIMGMREIETRQVSKQIEADAILQRYEPSLPIRQFLLTNLIRRPCPSDPKGQYLRFRIPLNTLAGALDHMADFPYRDPDDGSSVRPYKGAALFVRGSESRYVPDDVLPVVGRFFPLFKVVDVKAGHWVISQNPVDFRRAVVDFLLHDR